MSFLQQVKQTINHHRRNALTHAAIFLLKRSDPSPELKAKHKQATTKAVTRFVEAYGKGVPRTKEWFGRCQFLGRLLFEEYGVPPVKILKVPKKEIDGDHGEVSRNESNEIEMLLSREMWRLSYYDMRRRYLWCLGVTIHEAGHVFEENILADAKLQQQFKRDFSSLNLDAATRKHGAYNLTDRLLKKDTYSEKSADYAMRAGLRILVREIS